MIVRTVPKPAAKQKKQPKPLRSKTSLRSKTKLKSKKHLKKTYNPNPFPDEVKQQISERQGGRCAHPGCQRKIEHYHHIKNKGMGRRKVWWLHDARNGVGLCKEHHDLVHNALGKLAGVWRRFWERWAVMSFGWLGGQAVTVEEYDQFFKKEVINRV